MEEFRAPLSRAEAILENILGAENELQDPLSNVEEILLSILNDTPYEKEPETLIEEMLLAIKEGTEMDAIAKNRVEEILLAIIHGEEYTKLPLSRFEELLIEWLKESAVTEKFLDFAPILSFSDSAGKPLVECKVKIEPVQDLHGYDNPWPAGGGKNLFDISKMAEREGVTVSGNTFTGLARSFTSNGLVTAFNIPSGTTLNVSCSAKSDGIVTSGAGFALVFVYSDNTTLRPWYTSNSETTTTNHSGSVTAEKDIVGYRFIDYNNGADNTWTVNNFQIEIGSTATAYAPYENICPISGHDSVSVVRCGKNLVPSSSVTHPSNQQLRAWHDGTGAFLKAGTYTMSCTFGTVDGIYVNRYINGQNVTQFTKYNSSFLTFTLDKDTDGINLYFLKNNGDLRDYTIQLEYASTATTYEPYQGETYTIELGDTIYGGTLDVTTGKLVVDRAITNLEEGMTLGTIGSIPLWTKRLPEAKTVPNTNVANIVAEAYASIRFNAISANVNHVALRDSGLLYVNTGSDTVLPQGKLLYELATPITIQLTPQQITTLLGNNTLYADTGDISVKYLAKK